MACAPAIVSNEARFSFPSLCSATTRIMSAIHTLGEPKLPFIPPSSQLSFSVFVNPSAPQIRSVNPEHHSHHARQHVVVEHRMHPAWRILQVLPRPHQQQHREERELPGEHLENQSPLPALIQALHLRRIQVPFFRWDVHVGHLASVSFAFLRSIIATRYRRQATGCLYKTRASFLRYS